jgi:uncharacterized Zn finger protein
MNLSLTSILDELHLMRLAGERFYERGLKYFKRGAVVRLTCTSDSVSAKVRGTHDYRVKIWMEGKALAFECDCPIGMDGEFCKHCVAVGLTWIARSTSSDEDPSAQGTGNDLRGYLMARDKERLVTLLLERAEADHLFEQRLQMMAAGAGSKAVAMATLRQSIDGAIKRRSVQYDQMPRYVSGIEVLIESLEELLKDGHAVEVRDLTEYALKVAEKAMHAVDDSDGMMSGILERLEELHHAACVVVRPDQVALAKFLFEWEIEGDWDVFYRAAETYADVLGESGLAAHRAFATQAWERARADASRAENSEHFGRRSRIRSMMERYAEATGDVEALVAVKSQDLFGAIRFLEIAEIYKNAGKSDAAIEWAERGANLFPHHAGGLNNFLIAEYHLAGRHADAIALVWAKFENLQRLETYQELKKSASHLAQWPVWRDKALALLRASLAHKRKGLPSRWALPLAAGHSILVEIFLWEQKIEEAWEEAVLGGCSKELWLALADKRSKEHSAEAAEVYLRHVEPTIEGRDNAAYQEAVEMLGKIRKLKIRLGHPEEFSALVETLRVRHKPKRNLMKLLAAEGW